jgi:hypothetical protein
VDLVIVPLVASDTAVTLGVWSGRSGQKLGQVQVPLQQGTLRAAGQSAMGQRVRALLGGAPQRPAAPAPAPAWQTQPGGAQPQDVEPEPSEPDDDRTGLDLRLSAGAGMGMRSLEFPTESDPTLVDLGSFAVLHVDAAVSFAPSASFAIGPQLSYTTSFMHEVDEVHLDGPKRRMAVRSHRFEASLVPELRLNDAGTWRLSLAVGYAVRSLHPEVHHLLTPFYSLSGPMARLTLRIPFGDSAALRLGPEGNLIVGVSNELQELGVEGSGTAFGGEAAIEVRVSDAIWTELAYRESHAQLGSSLGDGASDVERYVTLRVVGGP